MASVCQPRACLGPGFHPQLTLSQSWVEAGFGLFRSPLAFACGLEPEPGATQEEGWGELGMGDNP